MHSFIYFIIIFWSSSEELRICLLSEILQLFDPWYHEAFLAISNTNSILQDCAESIDQMLHKSSLGCNPMPSQ